MEGKYREVCFSDKTFDYGRIYGYGGYILFVDYCKYNDLYVYDSNKDVLQKLDSKVYRHRLENNVLLYTTIDNWEEPRYSSGRICCCALDGSNKRTLYRQYGEGIIMLQEVTDTEISFKTLQGHKVKTITWDGAEQGNGLHLKKFKV